ncbi:type II toxin-antitoxin system RelE/ParE family toxin [bacterium]|nr:type II toxin-antitoxin system RelE/ParE family toxin [bacterium]
MKILQSRLFQKRVSIFSIQAKRVLDKQIKKIAIEPSIGMKKKGDLSSVYICKFKIGSVQYLLVYRFVEDDLELIMIGPHENYYRDLKNYLRTSEQDSLM